MAFMFVGNYGLEKVNLPNYTGCQITSTHIGAADTNYFDHTFYLCRNLKEVNLPSLHIYPDPRDSRQDYGNYTFRSMREGCSSLEYVNLNNVSYVGYSGFLDTFKDCVNLKEVHLEKMANGQTSSGTPMFDGTFSGCTSLELVDFHLATGVPSSSWGAFNNINNYYKIVVPDALYDTWVATFPWSDQSILPHIVKYHETCLTFTSQMDGTTISMRANGSAPTLDLEYTKDGLTWSDFTVGSTSVLIDEGEHASFRTKSTTDTVTSTGDADYNCFVVNGKATLSGSVASMVNKDHFHAKLPEGSNYALNRLFNAQHGIVGSLKNLKLPFKKLEENCYKCMFRDSGGITEAPELPATELAPECYHAMFELCTGLTTPCSKLEATDVPYRAYYHLFSQCYNLASAPAISAVDIDESGMEAMFNLCSHLSSAIDLSSVRNVENYGMKSIFNNCNVLPSVDVSNITWCHFNALEQAFEACWDLTSVELTSLNSISAYALNKTFSDCKKLKTIKFGPVVYVDPGQGTETFKNCWNLDILDLTDVEVAFGFAYPQGMNNSNFHIVVPDSLFNDFQTNWSNVADKIISETLFNANTSKYVD